MYSIPSFDTFPKNKFYLKRPGRYPVTIQEGGQTYNPCGFVADYKLYILEISLYFIFYSMHLLKAVSTKQDDD